MDSSIVISDNREQGNKAMASVLLLFYHLAESGGFINGETVYIDPKVFNGKDFIDVCVAPENINEISQEFLRLGAVIYLLCELNDILGERSDEFINLSYTRDLLNRLNQHGLSLIPELSRLLELFNCSLGSFNFDQYYEILDEIYRKYVLGAFAKLARG